jgi:hypothetical protein
LYHSNALLLTDATVLTGGGGAPGPLTNLNAEIYYPPYLYTSSGQPAVQPAITSVSSTTVLPGATLSVTVGPSDQISRLTFVRTGSATHANNSDQRFIDLPFQQSGQQVTATLPSDPTVLVPGNYMLFAFNTAGVPSTAQILLVDPTSSSSAATWSPWDTLGGYCVDGIAVSSWAPGRLDVFTIGGDDAVYHKAWDGAAWDNWESLGGGFISAPAAVSWGPNRIDVFGIGLDHALYHQWWDGSRWSGWAENLGGYCLYGVAAVSRGPNQLDVFVIGGDRAVWHQAFNGSAWSGWETIGGGFISPPAAAATANSIDLYVLGEDHGVYHNAWYDAAWHGWFSLGGYGVDGVAATTWPDVYTIGGDGAVWRNVGTGSAWSGWTSLGGISLSAPAAISRGPGRVDVFVVGGAHACWHTSYQ